MVKKIVGNEKNLPTRDFSRPVIEPPLLRYGAFASPAAGTVYKKQKKKERNCYSNVWIRKFETKRILNIKVFIKLKRNNEGGKDRLGKE